MLPSTAASPVPEYTLRSRNLLSEDHVGAPKESKEDHVGAPKESKEELRERAQSRMRERRDVLADVEEYVSEFLAAGLYELEQVRESE